MRKMGAAAVLGAWLLAWSGNIASADTGDATEKLLKETKLDFKKVKSGVFKLVVETKQGVAVVVVEEKKATWKDSRKNDVLYAYIYSEVLTTPPDFKTPTAMLARIAEVNDRIRFGSLGYVKNQDGSHSMFRNGTLFLKNCEAEQLEDMVYVTVGEKFHFQKEFRSLVDGDK